MKAALNEKFDDLIGSLYADATLPPVIVVDDIPGSAVRYSRTGSTPVLSQDESTDCPVFANWKTHYEFEAWAAHRANEEAGEQFQAMVRDVLRKKSWSPETAEFITMIDGLINVQKQYADKFGHTPVDQNKFIKSYVKHGTDTVMRADVY